MTLQTVRVKSSRMRRRRRVPTRSSCRKRTQCDRVLKEPKDEHQNQSSSGHRGTEVWRGRAAHLCDFAEQPGEYCLCLDGQKTMAYNTYGRTDGTGRRYGPDGRTGGWVDRCPGARVNGWPLILVN